jgi:hypothetical protein
MSRTWIRSPIATFTRSQLSWCSGQPPLQLHPDRSLAGNPEYGHCLALRMMPPSDAGLAPLSASAPA